MSKKNLLSLLYLQEVLQSQLICSQKTMIQGKKYQTTVMYSTMENIALFTGSMAR